MPIADVGKELVIPLRDPLSERVLLVVTTILAIGGSIVWIAFVPTAASILISCATIAAFGWGFVSDVVERRSLPDGASRALIVTRHGMSAPTWSVPWDGVRRVSIWVHPSPALWGLRIEPRKRDDIAWASSVFRANWPLSSMIEIPRTAFDRPLKDVIADLERFAGRSLS